MLEGCPFQKAILFFMNQGGQSLGLPPRPGSFCSPPWTGRAGGCGHFGQGGSSRGQAGGLPPPFPPRPRDGERPGPGSWRPSSAGHCGTCSPGIHQETRGASLSKSCVAFSGFIFGAQSCSCMLSGTPRARLMARLTVSGVLALDSAGWELEVPGGGEVVLYLVHNHSLGA